MAYDLNGQKQLIYDVLIHAIKTNSRIGFYNNDQSDPTYMAGALGKPTEVSTNPADDNELFQMLYSLTQELGDQAHTPIRTWQEFCKLAVQGFQDDPDRYA